MGEESVVERVKRTNIAEIEVLSKSPDSPDHGGFKEGHQAKLRGGLLQISDRAVEDDRRDGEAVAKMQREETANRVSEDGDGLVPKAMNESLSEGPESNDVGAKVFYKATHLDADKPKTWPREMLKSRGSSTEVVMVHNVIDDIVALERVEAEEGLHSSWEREPIAVTHQQETSLSTIAMSEHARDGVVGSTVSDPDIGVLETDPATLAELSSGCWSRHVFIEAVLGNIV